MNIPLVTFLLSLLISTVTSLPVSVSPLIGAAPSVLKAQQGGTGLSTTSPAHVGDCLTVQDDSPFKYTLDTCGSGGGGTPGGSDTQVQFNDAGSFGGTGLLYELDGANLLFTASPNGQDVNLRGGNENGDGSNGGGAELWGGTGGSTGEFPPSIIIARGGSSDDDEGGGIEVTGGTPSFVGTGGSHTILAGNGGNTSGSGGSISLTAGSAQGGDSAGGDLLFQAGAKSGAGTNGALSFRQSDALYNFRNVANDVTGKLDFSLLTGSHTFQLPDASGVFCLVGVLCDGVADGSFSTTSAAYFASVGLAHSTTSTAFQVSQIDKGYFFSTTSANAWGLTKGYITGIAWGSITGTLSSQTDLSAALYGKLGTSSALTAGAAVLYATGANTVASAATSTPTVTAPITYSGTLGNFVGGVGGTFGCTAASASVAGCVAAADWLSFNNKVSTSSIDSEAEIQTALLAGANMIVATEIDTCSEFAAIMGSETGTCGSLVLSADPTFTGLLTFANTTGAQATTTSLAVTGYASTSGLTVSNIRSAVPVASASGVLSAASTQTCTNQFFRVMSAAYVVTCATVGPTDIDLTATYAWTGQHTWPSTVKMGLGSTTPSALQGISIGTTTVMQRASFAVAIASSTTAGAVETVVWDTGNEYRMVLSQNTSVVINSTSSYPKDGGKYVLKVCQDPTGSRTLTFVTPGQLVWPTNSATTTVSSAASTGTLIGMVYDARAQRYDIVASSTMSTRSCLP